MHLTLHPLQALSKHAVRQYLGAQQVRPTVTHHTTAAPTIEWARHLPCTDVNEQSLGIAQRLRLTQCLFAGQGIAVSYGRFDVEGWCLQPGRLCAWNLARTGFDPNKPEVTVEVDSCLQCCAYHPQQPVCSRLLVFANAILLSHTTVSNIIVGHSICLSV